jgi:serine/threonine protein kinase/tetratricopeptide (TPR) repeat protein
MAEETPSPEMRRPIEGHPESPDAVGGEVAETILTDAHGSQAAGSVEQIGGVIGPYKLLQKLGEGGMGTVWVAEQSEPVKRRVAIKLIKIGMDTTDVLRRFEAERQALALMEHQNIAKVLDAGATPMGRPYFAMELIKGIAITRYCDQEHLTPRERLELFIPVCQAVQHAHQKGVIHRDLKPSNVLIALYDGKPVPKVIDFGLAKATSQKLTERTLYTEVGQIVGTLEYMAPEQAELNNLDIDTRADIYSLGVILYELLAGSPPFTAKQLRGAAFTEIVRMIREVEPPRPSTRLSSSDELPSIAANRKLEPSRLTRMVHGDLDWIVMKALEKDRARRYETANGFAMDIQRYLADEPVSAGPPGAGYRLRKLVRRNKGPVLAASAVAVALVVGVISVVAVQARANRALEAKNGELAAKNTELAVEQEKVQARFETAQKAIALFHTGVSEDMLLKNEQLKELRTKLLKGAAAFYADLEKLLAGQTDARSRRLLADGYFQLGELTEKIGSQPQALAVHRQALAMRRELAAPADTNVETRLDVARSLWKVGRLLDATGDKSGAMAAFEEQRELSERLAEAPSDAVLAILARSHFNIGDLLWQTGKPAEGLAAYQKALALQQKLVDANPPVNEFAQDLAWSHNAIGRLQSQTGHPAEALASYEKALVIRHRLAEANRSASRFQSELALTHNAIGELLWQTGKPAEALGAYQKALEIRQKLVDSNRAVSDFQRDLGNSYNSVGLLLTQTGKSDEGLASQQKALDIQKNLAEANPEVIVWQRDLAWTQNVIGAQLAYRKKVTEALASYERAQAIYQKLADTNPTVTLFQSDAARSRYVIGRLLSQTEKPAEALASYQQALDIRQKLADANPAVTDFQRDVAWSHHYVGELLSQTGKPAEALAAHQKALAIRQKLTDANPAVTDFQEDLAWSHSYMGQLLWGMGKWSEALGAYKKEITIRQKLADANPAFAQSQSALAKCYDDSGWRMSQMGKPAEALAAYQKALAIRQKLLDTNPADSQFQRNLADSELNIGWQFAHSGKNDEALEYYTREQAIRQKLAAAESASPDDTESLAMCQTNTADVLRNAGRLAEARAACERARALGERLVKEHPQPDSYRGGLAETYVRTGLLQRDAKDLAAAAASWKRAIALYEGLKSPDEEQTFLRACCHAGLLNLANRPGSGVSAEEGRAETERAMSWLRKAVTAGYGNPNAYRTESALDSLRGREDFKKLLADLAAKSRAGVK